MRPEPRARTWRALAACAVMAGLVLPTAPTALADPGSERASKPSRSQRGAGQMPAAAYAQPMGARPITATYGERGSWWFQGRHDGIDYDAETGDPVRQACDGTVAFAGNKGNWRGNFVTVRCRTGLTLTYAHLSSIRVKKGQEVQRGSVLGAVGSSGNTTGSHLHISAEMDGRSVDPSKYIPR